MRNFNKVSSKQARRLALKHTMMQEMKIYVMEKETRFQLKIKFTKNNKKRKMQKVSFLFVDFMHYEQPFLFFFFRNT